MIKRFFWCAILVVLVSVTVVLVNLPNTQKLISTNPTTWAIRETREAQIRQRGRKPQSMMIWKNLDQISPALWQAVMLSEDDSFFRHNGFDVEQLKRAARVNWERKRFAFGASTITQQLARTLYLSPRKNVLRKMKEALITRRLEKTLKKKRILELYLNVVEWGPQIYGAEAASRHFFNKSAIDLTADEAIGLAVILPSPRRWHPLKETKFIARRKAVLYDRMVRAKYIQPPVVIENIPPMVLPEDSFQEEGQEFETDRYEERSEAAGK